MHSFDRLQANFIATINNGPDALDHKHFTGPIDRVLLGMKAHANTISHARLVALEETFPLTRQAMGDTGFNNLSREFIETKAARASDNNGIGRGFSGYLRRSGSAPEIEDLAAIEWAWLESYHASDAKALELCDIAGMPQDQLLGLLVHTHPSAHIVSLTAPLHAILAEVAAILPNPVAILSVRPNAEVKLVPLGEIETAVFAKAQKNTTIGNLLTCVAEHHEVTDPIGPIMTLLGAGALVEN
jgi:Putative DNA-binding domain